MTLKMHLDEIHTFVGFTSFDRQRETESEQLTTDSTVDIKSKEQMIHFVTIFFFLLFRLLSTSVQLKWWVCECVPVRVSVHQMHLNARHSVNFL